MVRVVAVVVLALASRAAAQELELRKKPLPHTALAFEVGFPEGWTYEQDRTGLVVRDAKPGGVGFQITREPFLHDPGTFAEEWHNELGRGGIEAAVKEVRAARLHAYHAAWQVDANGGRDIAVWRIHSPDNEMLYNVSFSAPKGQLDEKLTETILDSFKVTANKPKLVFQTTPATLGPRTSLQLPEGYAEQPRGVRLGGGTSAGFLKLLEGYAAPHEAGRIVVQGFSADRPSRLPDGTILRASDLKETTEYMWRQAQTELGKVTKKARTKPGKAGKTKGVTLQAEALTKEGLPKQFYAFAGKIKQTVVVIAMLVDDREARLYKDLFKDVCATFDVKED